MSPLLDRHLTTIATLAWAMAVASPAHAAPLSPAAGDRVASQAAVVASEIHDAIAEGETDATENLRRLVDTDDAPRIYHRDHQVLVAMTTRRNLFVGDKRAGERQAAELVRDVLQAKFSHLLETENGFQGLDASAVRVVFVEPDAFDACPGRRPSRRGGMPAGQTPVSFGGSHLWANGWATPAPCTTCN